MDSDANVDTGLTDPVVLADGANVTTIAAGLIQIQFFSFVATVTRGLAVEICDSSSPYWMAVISGNPSYRFCSKQDLEFVAGLPPVVRLNKGSNQDLSLKWNIFGISGIWLSVQPNSQQCGELGRSASRYVPVNGSNGISNTIYSLNANEFDYGGYKIELFILNNQGMTVGYNEKFLCVT